jgi:hypothetical protein
MDATMDVRVVPLVVVRYRVDHLARSLGRRCVVEIDQWLAVNGLVQRRKVPPQGREVGFDAPSIAGPIRRRALRRGVRGEGFGHT